MKDMSFKTTFKSYLLVFLAGILALLANGEALAASADVPRQPVVGASLLIAFAIVYLSRRRAIGGWLLYFYIQLYLSLTISLVFVSQVLSNLDPSQWDNSFLYVMFFLSVVPVLATGLLEVVAATKLLFRKNEQNVKFLRKTLIALVATSAIAIAVNIGYFRDVPMLFFDVLTLAFAIIWTLYFSKARRVRLVFVEKNWIYIPYLERRRLTAEDKKKLRNRALVSALVTFVLLLLMLGFVFKDEGKQPDMGIFNLAPLFYAVVAAIIAWYLPVRKKKKETSTVEDISANTVVEEKEITMRPDDNIWKIALALVCIGILAYGFFHSKNTTTNLTYLFVYTLLIALFVWAIFYAAVARKRRGKVAGFSFLAIFICMIAGDLIGYSQQNQEAKQALSEIQDQYSALIESSTDSQGLPKRIEKPINTTPKASGEFGEVERFMKEFIDQMVSQRNDYILELQAIGWNGILDVNRIKADKTFIESKVTIQKAKEVVKKYKEQINTLLSNVKDNIRSLNVNETSKREMLSGFDRGMEKAKKNIDALWSLESKTINEFENIINLLSARKGAWIVEGEQILFYNDSDLERFNYYMASIQKMVGQQEEIQRQSVQTVKRKFDQLKVMK